jgi:hypothetical protein
VRVRVSAAPLLSIACHCTGCQRMSASAFSLSLVIPKEGVAVLQGEPIVGGLHGATRHFFCPECLSWMFTRPEGMDSLVNLRATMLDDPSWAAPFVETYMCEKLPWATTPAPHKFAQFPPREMYAELIEGYAARGSRPG